MKTRRNPLYRSWDDRAREMGQEVSAPASPRKVPVKLTVAWLVVLTVISVATGNYTPLIVGVSLTIALLVVLRLPR
jgi:hypothetical protein